MYYNDKVVISRFINGREKPLTMYIFSEDKAVQVKIILLFVKIYRSIKRVSDVSANFF